jgi:hypothetical protein
MQVLPLSSSQPLQVAIPPQSYGGVHRSINEINDTTDDTTPAKIDDIQIKNLRLFIFFNTAVLATATVLVTMMLIGYNNVRDSKGREFLLVASVITGVFMFSLVTSAVAVLLTKSLCISILFFTVFTLYTAVHFVLAVMYIVFFFVESEWKSVSCLVVAFFFYMMGLVQCLFNGKGNSVQR